jgi:uncharacterized membrane protein YfcA
MFDFLWSDYFLIGISFFTSLVTAVMGVGGGVMLMIFMLMFYPPLTVIPVHGVVQMGSNVSRAFFLRDYIHWPFLIPFAIGVGVGSFCGSQFVLNIPQDTLRMVVGILALIFTWMPKFKSKFEMPYKIPALGWLSSFLGMFGAGGGMVLGVAMARMNLSKQQTIATHAICMTALHVTKVVIFGLFGFAFAPYLPLIIFMMISGLGGSWVGTKILHKIDSKIFVYLLKGMISLLCLKLIIWG